MQVGLSAEQQITALQDQLAQRDALIAELTGRHDAHEAERAEVAFFKAQLTAALLEIEQLKVQLEALRRQRFGCSSEKLDQAIAQRELRLEDLEENLGEQIAANPRSSDPDAEPSPIGKARREARPSSPP